MRDPQRKHRKGLGFWVSGLWFRVLSTSAREPFPALTLLEMDSGWIQVANHWGTWDVGKAVAMVFAEMSDYWILGSRASAAGTEHA